MFDSLNVQAVILWMAAACGLALALLVFRKRLGGLLRMALWGLVGLAGIALVNRLLSGLGISAGINPATFAAVAALGFPGFVTVYILNMML